MLASSPSRKPRSARTIKKWVLAGRGKAKGRLRGWEWEEKGGGRGRRSWRAGANAMDFASMVKVRIFSEKGGSAKYQH